MKSKVNIKTLTPVHIGSGTNYPNNIEFITQKDNDGTLWGGIVDVNKIFDIIGFQNLHKWTTVIEKKQNIFDFLYPFKPNIPIEDICKRIFGVFGEKINDKKDLKEQLHSRKNAMIPGSSLKGAFRTAILSHLIKKFPESAKRVINNYSRKKDFYNWSLYDFQKINTEIENIYLTGVFKKNANNDIFRFLILGDVLFDESSTIATVVKVLSLRRNGWEFKEGNQLTECIGNDVNSNFTINIRDLDIRRNQENNNIKITDNIKNELLSIFSSIENLFEIVNKHTKQLLNKEIILWEEQIKNPNPVNEIIENYLDNLKSVKNNFSDNNKQCILRVGGNEGWDFITGAWANAENKIFTNEQWDKLYHLLNKGRKVDIFPKSRKIDEDGDLMGFVRLEII